MKFEELQDAINLRNQEYKGKTMKKRRDSYFIYIKISV